MTVYYHGQASKGWKRFFLVAAIFNFLIGLAGMLTPESTIDGRIIGLLVFAFGVVYYLVSRDPYRYAPVLWAGVLGKLGVIGLLAPQGFVDAEAWPVLALLAGDAIFTIGFLIFLMKGDDRSTL